MENLNFIEKRFQIALSYIGEILNEKNFTKQDNYFSKDKLTIIVNKITNTYVNNNLILIFILVNEVGNVVTSSSTIIESDSNLESNFTNIDKTLKSFGDYLNDTSKPYIGWRN